MRKLTCRRRVVLAAAVLAAVGLSPAPVEAITINLNFQALISDNPPQDPTGLGLAAIMTHVRDFYQSTFLDSHTIQINYRWATPNNPNALAAHTLIAQGGGRETEGTIVFNPNVLFFIDATPADNSFFNMQQTLWRDLTAAQRTNWYNAGANIPDTFEVGFTGAALATAPAEASNRIDLLSVAFHEVGHALGMSAQNTSTQIQTADGDYDFNTNFVFGRTLAARIAPNNNIAHLAANPATMFPTIGTGVRQLPGHTDLFSMASGHFYQTVAVPRREFYGGTNWNAAGNWSGNRVPNSATDAFVRNPGFPVNAGLSANGFVRNLLIAEGSWVTTNTHTLTASGEITIIRDGAAGQSLLRVSSGGTVSASRITADAGGTLSMLGGFASGGTITTTQTGGITGQGTIVVSGRLLNSGAITASGGTLVLNTTGSGRLDLDGPPVVLFGPETGVVNATAGNIVVNGTMNDAFNGTINIGSGRRINFNTAWTLGETALFTAAGRLNLNGGTNAASAAILGGTGPTSLNGVVNVTGQGSIAANVTLNSPTITIASGGTLLFGNATFNGGSYTGAGRIGFDGSTIIASDTTISVANFDFDGNFLGHTFTINSGATLTVNSAMITDAFDEFLVVNGVLEMNTSNAWINNGTTTLNSGRIGGSATMTASRVINSTGSSQITAHVRNMGFDVHVANGSLTTNGGLSSNGAFVMNKRGAGMWLISGNQSHAPGATMNIHDSGTVSFHSNAGAGGQNLIVNVNRFGTVRFATEQRLASLSIGVDADAVAIASGRLIHTRELSIVGGATPVGRFNLGINALAVDYTGASPLNTIRAQIVSGYASGNWDGNGIFTSLGNATTHGLGYAEASAIFSSFPATFFGEEVDDTTVLVRYTRYGDANLDGIVNLADFNRLAANFGSTNAQWWQGDFNYDGMVNLADFNRLAANFGLSASGTFAPTPDDWAALAAAVPEPALLSLLSVPALAMLRRRRA